MKIGIISYLNSDKDEAYVVCISEENFKEKYYFKPSLILFEISLEKLICIQDNATAIFSEFIPEQHSKYINYTEVRKTSGINLTNNKTIVEFLLDSNIADKYNSQVAELNAIKDLFNLDPFGRNSTVKLEPMENMVLNYETRYYEGGYDKPGDWSKAWITVSTRRPSNLPNSKLDPYLENLFPKFEIKIASGNDDIDNPFKSDILAKLRDDLGEKEIIRIKKLCEDMTRNVREMALLAYNANDHANFLAGYSRKLKLEIINRYK